ncbi:MAG: sulfopyruvate decarboxylase subunit beta [Methanomicrobiaceae archaeon]|nr:sulfopyruvate decarboxylase subunit beta [Methanomicrobiaceae archaeon]
MPEKKIESILKDEGIDFVVSLPCDRTKDLCALLNKDFHYVNINREEDGIGVCAGLALAGRRFVLQMQSSGLGNSLNALMSLTHLYGLPLPIIASWRGVYNEKIAAQVPFNAKIPEMLDAMDIPYTVIEDHEDLEKIRDAIRISFEKGEIHVILILPKLWEESDYRCEEKPFPPRERETDLHYRRKFAEPVMNRLEAITVIANELSKEAVVVNIGVPCKEMNAARDRPENFYMLGSYTQATPIGLGLALGQEKEVIVIDGDGSLLGTAILPAVAAEKPRNMTIIALDNGAFGSTGMQQTHSWTTCDLELIAKGAGIKNTVKTGSAEELKDALLKRGEGPSFIHVIIKPGNTNAPNLTLTPEEIRDRFVGSIEKTK